MNSVIVFLSSDPDEEAQLCRVAWQRAYDSLPQAWTRDPDQRYQMVGYEHPSTSVRLRAFEEGKLDDLGDTALLIQDVLEAGMVTRLDLDMYKLAAHMVNAGICTINGRALQ